ncbi:unnamed protein product [Leuciscus chuanchicus]
MAVRCSAPAVWRVSSELKTQQTFGSVCNRAAKGERQREIETEKEKDESSSVNPSTRVSHGFSCRRAWTREPYTTSSPPPTAHHANARELDVPRVAVGMSSREGCPASRGVERRGADLPSAVLSCAFRAPLQRSRHLPRTPLKLEIRLLEQFLTDSGRQPDLFSKDSSDGITEELVYDNISNVRLCKTFIKYIFNQTLITSHNSSFRDLSLSSKAHSPKSHRSPRRKITAAGVQESPSETPQTSKSPITMGTDERSTTGGSSSLNPFSPAN